MARVLYELEPVHYLCLPACNKQWLDNREKRKLHSLKSSVPGHNRLPATHSCNVGQLMRRIHPPWPPIRSTNWQCMTTIYGITSRPTYSVLSPPYKEHSQASKATPTTYTSKVENAIPYAKEDCLSLRQAVVNFNCRKEVTSRVYSAVSYI